ncbi:aminotransferase class V-fold PLP-dependent enzyme [Microbacterium lacus]|uniref:aminotransferase class V-fold PLP-dependent enzyme n=1 Tax=Microbacterium lacus TaxID=415217 RepID=UPI00385172A1
MLCPEGDFSSLLLPFEHAGRGIHLRCVPLESLAAEITDRTALVAFSLVQSATGEVADSPAVAAAAARHGARTLCDATQAVGWMPVDASMFDALICHAYKWLCAPRGVAFCALSPSFAASMRPVFAGWYSGEDPWSSCYGHDAMLATCARRIDVSPAWQAFVGAEPALAAFADTDPAAVYSHVVELATAFRERMGLSLPQRPSAIVTWADPDGCDLARLSAAGIIASGRAGPARVAFHVFNDLSDVERAVAAFRE